MKLSIPFEHLVSKNEKHTTRKRHTQKWTSGLDAARLQAQQQAPDGFQPFDEPVVIVLYFFEPTRHRRDIHNYEELVLDAIEGIAYTDDYYIFSKVSVRAGFSDINDKIDVFDDARVDIYVEPLKNIDVTIHE